MLVEGSSKNGRRCTHCATEKTPRWLHGPDGPSTLCNACGQQFKKGRLLQSKSRRRGCCSSSLLNSAASNNLVAAWPCGVGPSLDAFFDQMDWEVSCEEDGPARAGEEEEELEWLSNKDAFPSLETMAVEVEEAPALYSLPVPAAARRRVTAMETGRQANVPPAEKATRRCTHCATEQTPAWRLGPEGPTTLCNPCGILFGKIGCLLPEYRPANSPAFSPLLHSNKYNRALQMNHQNKTSATGEVCSELTDGAANGTTSSPAQRYSSLRHVLKERLQTKEETSAAIRAPDEDGNNEVRHEFMEMQRPPADCTAFSLMSHNRMLKGGRKSEQKNFAAIRATAKARGYEHDMACLAAMHN